MEETAQVWIWSLPLRNGKKSSGRSGEKCEPDKNDSFLKVTKCGSLLPRFGKKKAVTALACKVLP